MMQRSELDKIQRCNDSINRLQSELASRRAELAEKEAKLSKVKEELNGHTTSVRTSTQEINRLNDLERNYLREVHDAEDATERLRNNVGAQISRAIPLVNLVSEPVHQGNLRNADRRVRAARDNLDQTRNTREAHRKELLKSQQEVSRITPIVTGQIKTSNELRQRIAVLESAVAELEIQLINYEEEYSKLQASLES